MVRAFLCVRVQLLLPLLLVHSFMAECYQFKVGDLDAWGLPPPSNPHIYSLWSQKHSFRVGDSLLFLYPPSEDTVIQVTEKAYNSCSLADPILRMTEGNSVFNVTAPGIFYFTSGVPDRCQKNQKLVIAVASANGTFFPPAASDGPSAVALPATSPMYPTVFGPTKQPSLGASPAAASSIAIALLAAGAAGFLLLIA